MPYIADVYQLPPGTSATPNTTVASAPYNTFIADITTAQNTARPVLGGGTGGQTAVAGNDGLNTQGANIASSGTTNLAAATGVYVNITGTTTITSFGTVAAGAERVLTFTGILTLTYNATSMILPGAASITTAAGDSATFRSLGAGNWKCVVYQLASGAGGADASTTVKGIVELATDAETQTGTDTTRAVTPSNITAKEATAANYRANTADRILTTDQVWSAASLVTLTDAATIAVDMSTFINAQVTLGGNRTLGAPTNDKPGQTGVIRIIQDGTGSRTLAFNAAWVFAGGVDPVLSTAASAEDYLFYYVPFAGRAFANLIKAVA